MAAAPCRPVAIEQFDLQSPDVPSSVFDEGWHEPEYNPRPRASWRWMTERAALSVRPVGRDVTLTIAASRRSLFRRAVPPSR